MEIELQEEQKQDLIRSLADEKSIDNISAYIQLQKDKITNLKKEKNLLLRKINEKEYTLINIDEEITRLKQVLDNSYSRKAVLSEYLDSEKQRAEITMEQLITEKEFLLRKKENLMSELIETRKMKQQGEKKVSKKEERVQNENLIPQTEQEPTGGSGIPGLFIGSLIIVIIILISLFFIGKNTSKLKTN